MDIEAQRRIASNFVSGISGGGTFDRRTLAEGWDCWNAALGGINRCGLPQINCLHASGAAGTAYDSVRHPSRGDQVAVRAVSDARLPDGTDYRNRYVFIFTFTKGKAAQLAAYFDTQTANTLLLLLVKARQRAAEAGESTGS